MTFENDTGTSTIDTKNANNSLLILRNKDHSCKSGQTKDTWFRVRGATEGNTTETTITEPNIAPVDHAVYRKHANNDKGK